MVHQFQWSHIRNFIIQMYYKIITYYIMVKYCVRCREKTESMNITEVISKNNRPMLQSICSVCGNKKSSFIKKESTKSGGDIVSSVISKIPVELHLRTLKGKKYSFCGPNTNLAKRLNTDDTPKEWSKPINKVDAVCLQHDLAYRDSDLGKGTRHEADKKMIEELDNLKDLNISEKLARAVIRPTIAAKHKLGLGVKSKNSKKGSMKRK